MDDEDDASVNRRNTGDKPLGRPSLDLPSRPIDTSVAPNSPVLSTLSPQRYASRLSSGNDGHVRLSRPSEPNHSRRAADHSLPGRIGSRDNSNTNMSMESGPLKELRRQLESLSTLGSADALGDLARTLQQQLQQQLLPWRLRLTVEVLAEKVQPVSSACFRRGKDQCNA